MDLKLLLLALVVSSAHHPRSKVEAAVTAPAANNNFLSEVTTLRWAQETVTCFKPQKQMTAAQKFKARLSSQGHGRDVSTKHKQCKLRI